MSQNAGPYMHFSKGKPGSAGSYCRYILRPEAVLDDHDIIREPLLGNHSPIWVRNIPKYVTEGVVAPNELRSRLSAFATVMGQLERHRHRGRGLALEYFRATASFAAQIRPTPEEAQAIADKFLSVDFSKARVIASLHRNTEHYHINLHILARDRDGWKLDLGQRYFRMDQQWAKVYLRATQPDPALRLEMFRLHLEKKYETKRFREEVKQVMHDVRLMGYKITQREAERMIGKPERYADYRNIPLHPHAKEAVRLATAHLQLREISSRILAAPESAEAHVFRREFQALQLKEGGIDKTGKRLGELLRIYSDDPIFLSQVRRLAGPKVFDGAVEFYRGRELGGESISGPRLELSL